MAVSEALVDAVPFGVHASIVHETLPGLVGGVVATGVGVVATVSGVRGLRDWWRVRAADPASVREAVAVDGVARIRGTVRPPRSGDALVSPIRGERCVAYEYDCTRQVQGTGDPSIGSGTDHVPFVVSDETGAVRVEPTEGCLSLTSETETVTGETALLDRVDERWLDSRPSARSGPIDLVEGTIGVGDRVTVVGRVRAASEADPVGGVATPETGHLLVTDDRPAAAALRTGARGAFLLVLGVVLILVGSTAFAATVD
jgi:hypothetical protein